MPAISEPRHLNIPDGGLRFYPEAFSAAEADRYFQSLSEALPWRQDRILIAGRRVAIPRLQAWFGKPYAYSGLRLRASPWHPDLLQIKERVEVLCGQRFNALLANYYRDGNDSVSWHSDNEKSLGPDPIIASVSLGAARDFDLRHRKRRDLGLETKRYTLPHGSLLVMDPPTQQFWEHCLPKRRRLTAPRINLTFRQVRR